MPTKSISKTRPSDVNLEPSLKTSGIAKEATLSAGNRKKSYSVIQSNVL